MWEVELSRCGDPYLRYISKLDLTVSNPGVHKCICIYEHPGWASVMGLHVPDLTTSAGLLDRIFSSSSADTGWNYPISLDGPGHRT